MTTSLDPSPQTRLTSRESPALCDIALRIEDGSWNVEAGIAVWMSVPHRTCALFKGVKLAESHWEILCSPPPAPVPSAYWPDRLANRDEIRADATERAIARDLLRTSVLDPGLDLRCDRGISLDPFGRRFVRAFAGAGVTPTSTRLCRYCFTPFRPSGRKKVVTTCESCRKHGHELRQGQLVARGESRHGARSWDVWCDACGAQFVATDNRQRFCDSCSRPEARQRRSRSTAR